MVIRVDQEGREAIQQLCDVALRVNGITNLEGVNIILRAVEEIEEEGSETEVAPLKDSSED